MPWYPPQHFHKGYANEELNLADISQIAEMAAWIKFCAKRRWREVTPSASSPSSALLQCPLLHRLLGTCWFSPPARLWKVIWFLFINQFIPEPIQIFCLQRSKGTLPSLQWGVLGGLQDPTDLLHTSPNLMLLVAAGLSAKIVIPCWILTTLHLSIWGCLFGVLLNHLASFSLPHFLC